MDSIFTFGWHDIPAGDAFDLDLEYYRGFKWQGFHIELFGYGFLIAVRAVPAK